MVYIYTDGASRGNGGPSAGSFIIEDGGYNELARHSDYLGNMTNFMAEYMAIYNAIKFAYENGFVRGNTPNTLISDSEIVINQLKGKYKINHPNLKKINESIKTFLQFSKIHMTFEWAPRTHSRIKECDKMNNHLLDSMKLYAGAKTIRDVVDTHEQIKSKPSSDGYYYSDFTRTKKLSKSKPKRTIIKKKICRCK